MPVYPYGVHSMVCTVERCAVATVNPLLVPSTLPYGLPDFSAIRDEHVMPALQEALRRHKAEIDTIAHDPTTPTAMNTVVALEQSGQDLSRVVGYFYTVAGADATDERLRIEGEISPLLAQHTDDMYMNADLFSRIDTVFHSLSESLGDLAPLAEKTQIPLADVEAETSALVRRYHELFLRHGAGLDAAAQARVREINAELSRLSSDFGDTLLKDTQARAVHITDEAELEGVEESQKAFFADTARAAGKDGWLIPLGLPTVQPILEQLARPDVRARIYDASLQRGGQKNETIAQRMALLRAEKAELFGYRTHAELVISDETARTPEAALQLLTDLAPAAVRNAERERAELLPVAQADGCTTLSAADWPYYAEKVRAAHYSLDSAELKPYFRLRNVVEQGVFRTAEILYGLRITKRDDLHGYTPDTDVWEVTDATTGEGLALLLTDYFTRPTKRGGAWMNSIIDQNALLGQKPIVINVLNLTPAPAGEDTLLTLDEVETLFHEFGHALHGMLSKVIYPLFSGTNVPRDFVEFPSQFNEMWALHNDTLPVYATNAAGDTIPPELVEKVRAAQKFGQGFATVEYLAACIIDMAWHTLTRDGIRALGEDIDVAAFETAALQRAGLHVEGIAPRYRTRYYQHIFSNGYSAGYYSYLWSEVLDADTVDWFNEQGGLVPEAGQRFRKMILSRGGSIDYMTAYRDFRSRDKDVTPLLLRRGLV